MTVSDWPAMPKDTKLENGMVYVGEGKEFDIAVYEYAVREKNPLLWFTSIHPNNLKNMIITKDSPLRFDYITNYPDHEENEDKVIGYSCKKPNQIEKMVATTMAFSTACKEKELNGIVHLGKGMIDLVASENGEKYATKLVTTVNGIANKHRSNCVTLNISPLSFSTIEYNLMSRSNDFTPLFKKD